MFYIAESCPFGGDAVWLKEQRSYSLDYRTKDRAIVEVERGNLPHNFTYRQFQVIHPVTRKTEGVITLTVLPANWGRGNPND